MKKILITSAVLLAFSSVGFASPLADYSQGKVALDVTVKPSNDLEGANLSLDGKKNTFNYGLTVGLGNNFAFQYKNNRGDSKDYPINTVVSGYAINGSISSELKAQEFNMLYKVDKNLSAFIGYTDAKASIQASGTVNGIPSAGEISGKSVKGYQVGLIATTALDDKTTAYGVLGLGNKINSYEIGLGYALSKDVDLNLFYNDTKYKGLTLESNGVESGEFDYKVKGFGYGVTFKF